MIALRGSSREAGEAPSASSPCGGGSERRKFFSCSCVLRMETEDPMSTLTVELLISTLLVILTVALHLIGLEALLLLTGLHLRFLKSAWLRLDRLLVPLGIALGLFVLHGAEIWIYAGAYRLLGALPDFESALF